MRQRVMKKTILALLGLITFAPHVIAEGWFPYKKAHNAYNKKDFETAKSILEKEQVEKPNDPLINYNLGTVYYKQKDYPMAKLNFQRAATHAFSSNKSLLKKSYFNLGNSFYQNTLSMLPDDWEKDDTNLPDEIRKQAIEEVKQSIEKYKQILSVDKKNKRSETNKKRAEELLAKLEKKQNKNQNNKNKNDKKENKDKQNDQKKQNKNQEQNKDDKQDKKQDQQKQQNKNNEKEQQQQKQQQPQHQDFKQRKMQAMLKELEEDEKKLQKKLLAQKVKNTKQAKNDYQKPW